ncbi:MAG: Gfo/Idh/MocA family protein [Promethearchaeota archaeon]
MKELRVGIIGVGLKGGDPRYAQMDDVNFFGHLQSIQSIIDEGIFKDEFDIRLAAFGDTDGSVLERLGKLYPDAHLSAECFDILDEKMVDAVWIATPTAFHKEYFLRAARQGIHVYVEKPVTFWPSEIDELIAARDENGITCQVGLSGRNLPLVPYLAGLYRKKAGKWGRLMNVVFRDEQEKPYLDRPLHPSMWRKDKNLAHAGILFEHSCHDLDALMYIFGDIKRVYGKVNYFAGYDGIEDSVAAVLELEDGASISMSCVWTNVEHDERWIEVYCENAFIQLKYGVDGLDYRLVERGREKKPSKFDGLVVMAEYLTRIGYPAIQPLPMEPTRFGNIVFFDALAKGRPASPSLEDARHVQSVIEAVYLSSREGKPVEI